MKDKVLVKGSLLICLKSLSGKILEKEKIDNLVVTTGRYHIADLLAGGLQAPMSHMALGIGTTAQIATDTALQTELNRQALDSVTLGEGVDANKIIYVCEWGPAEATGPIAEAGIFNSLSAGIMLCRTTFAVKNKGETDSLSLTWTITIAG